jgi:hypothetical protein
MFLLRVCDDPFRLFNIKESPKANMKAEEGVSPLTTRGMLARVIHGMQMVDHKTHRE